MREIKSVAFAKLLAYFLMKKKTVNDRILTVKTKYIFGTLEVTSYTLSHTHTHSKHAKKVKDKNG